MRVLWLILAGAVGGVLAGMGLGGGTLLIPILTLLLDVPYRISVWVNLVVFLPTAIVALTVHCKNGIVDGRAVGRMLLTSSLGLFIGFFLAGKLSEDVMRKVFGFFMIAVGATSLFLVLFGCFMKNKKMH